MRDTLTDIYDRIRKVRRPRPARLLAVVALVLAVSACDMASSQEKARGGPADSWTWTNVAGAQTACLDNGDRLYGYNGTIAVVPGGCRT